MWYWHFFEGRGHAFLWICSSTNHIHDEWAVRGMAWENTCKFEDLSWAWSVGRALVSQAWGMGLIPRAHVKCQAWGAHLQYYCWDIETAGFLGHTGKPIWLNWQVLGQWETLSGRTILRMTLEIILWSLRSHTNVCMHICFCTYGNIHTEMHTHIQCNMNMVVHTYNQHLGGRNRMITISLRSI